MPPPNKHRGFVKIWPGCISLQLLENIYNCWLISQISVFQEQSKSKKHSLPADADHFLKKTKQNTTRACTWSNGKRSKQTSGGKFYCRMRLIKILHLNRLFSNKCRALLVKQCIVSVNKHPSIFKQVFLNGVTGVSDQYVEILIELVNTCCFLISVIYRLFPCENRILSVSNDYC